MRKLAVATLQFMLACTDDGSSGYRKVYFTLSLWQFWFGRGFFLYGYELKLPNLL